MDQIGRPLRPPLAPVKSKVRRRKRESIPEQLRQEVIAFAQRLQGNFAGLFHADPRLKHYVSRLLASTLPPPPRHPGRPGYHYVTQALSLLDELRRRHPGKSHRWRWKRVYPAVIQNYDSMNKVERRGAQQELRDRVRWRRRAARKRALSRV
jgi:hypothetical protein